MATRTPRTTDPRAAAREAYRDAILQAADRVFARRGFAGTKITEIAREAGVATGTLYNYFDNKDAIYRSLVAWHGERFRARVGQAFAAPGAVLDVVRASIRAPFEFLEENRAGYAVFFELSGGNPAAIERIGGEAALAIHDWYDAQLVRVLSRAVDEGALRADIDVATLVAALTGVMSGMCTGWISGADERPLADRASDVFELFLHGAKAQ